MSLLNRILLTFPPLFFAVGSFAADYNESHVLNPRWPPHARFHNGQTMTSAITLLLGCAWFTWRLPFIEDAAAKKEALVASWIMGSMYSVTAMSGILYPGSSGVDPEFFSESVGHYPQKYFWIPQLVNTWALWREWRAMSPDTRAKVS